MARSGSASGVPDLDLTSEGLKLVTLTFGVNLYMAASFCDHPKAVRAALDLFLGRCPRSALRYYATETMRVHKPVTDRAMGMIPTWLKPGAPRKEYFALELKSGQAYQDAPEFKFEVWESAKSQQANLVSIAFPAIWSGEAPDEMLEFVRQLCELFPISSGLAGYAFECSRYAKEESQTHAWRMSMLHPGIDIVRVPVDAKAAGTDAVKGVGWLTLLGQELTVQLGDVKKLRTKLPRGVDLIETKHALIIKAGPAPAAGDVNRGDTLPLYRGIYEVLAPLIDVAAERSMSFNLVDDFVERTEAWFARLRR
jgi:hypothetical protein